MSDEYKYQPDSPHVASSIQTHDDPYRNTRTHPPTADRDDLAAILAKHRWISMAFRWTGCSCDPLWWKGYESAGKTEDMYFAHVASMVLESDWLRDVKAGTWEFTVLDSHRLEPGDVIRMTGPKSYQIIRPTDTPDNTTDRTHTINK